MWHRPVKGGKIVYQDDGYFETIQFEPLNTTPENAQTPAIAKALEADKYDVVNKPKHYNHNHKGIECIDAIEAALTPDEFKGYLKGNTFKYVWRLNYKGKPLEDAEKAQWYLAKLITKLKGK